MKKVLCINRDVWYDGRRKHCIGPKYNEECTVIGVMSNGKNQNGYILLGYPTMWGYDVNKFVDLVPDRVIEKELKEIFEPAHA
jgi:hypothetical protein